MKYPRIYLAIDNCFAYKRWTEPADWARVISETGVRYIEASADTELDPLYMGQEYLAGWITKVRSAERDHDVKVVNLYSGHGTYSTLGLTHTDAGVRSRMIEQWFKPLIATAAELGAGLGFFAHGFSEAVLQEPARYSEYVAILVDGLVKICQLAHAAGCGLVGLEQMYTPSMVPWRLEETASLIAEVWSRAGHPLYITEDLGHHHVKFVRPTDQAIQEGIRSGQAPWLAALPAYAVFERACRGELAESAALTAIHAIQDEYPYLFASAADGDCYEWLRRFGAYSPIVHLQQTDGRTSAHWQFTPDNNRRGIIRPARVLQAIKNCYDAPELAGLPARVETIYLTLEAFAGTTAASYEILRDYRESVRYWREYIPQDGLALDELLDRLPGLQTI